jgi:hypothetical protein
MYPGTEKDRGSESILRARWQRAHLLAATLGTVAVGLGLAMTLGD